MSRIIRPIERVGALILAVDHESSHDAFTHKTQAKKTFPSPNSFS